MDHLESFIADCDRRTELAKKRLAETQEEISAEVAAKVSKKDFWTHIVKLVYPMLAFDLYKPSLKLFFMQHPVYYNSVFWAGHDHI